MLSKFPHYRQLDQKDCGPTCIKIIAKHYGKNIPIQKLRDLAQTNRIGTSLKGLSYAAEQIGFRTLSVKITLQDLETVPQPCIIYWNTNHFIVLYKVKKGIFYVSDPAFGLLKYTAKEFLKGFTGQTVEDSKAGYVMLFDTTPDFNNKEFEKEEDNTFGFLRQYVVKYTRFFNQLFIGIFALSIINLIFPFLTQAIVDVGIQNQDLSFIYLILLAQLMLFVGKAGLNVIRSWIVLHVTKRINISVLADFFRKMMRLPIAFFDAKMIGDLFQRISDHERIEKFIANTSIETIISLFNLLTFGVVLGYYNMDILFIFLGFTVLYVVWLLLFMKRRRVLDYKQFSENSANQDKIFELLTGMKEIKINNAELQKRWEWEKIQARLFKISIKNLSLEQWQSVGSQLINELKNIIISFYAAKLVIDGEITLGMMLSVSYMVGQLNIPLLQILNLFTSYQDAKIGISRFNEIYDLKDEDEAIMIPRTVSIKDGIKFENVSFRYNKLSKGFLFDNLNLFIPANKTTAIVGLSGSGKTTLLKLMLKFYALEKGSLKFDQLSAENTLAKDIRAISGIVMQEGMIFPNTVVHNITIGNEYVDYDRLEYALKIANIKQFVDKLPKGVYTEIGKNGIGMSTGQKQRILIARAIYKDPELLLFDEATSALDAENEKVIMTNLTSFFENRTVVVVAHRLSTVKNADKIVVLNNGRIVEEGNHKELTAKRGAYYELVKNQLELGN